MRVAPLMNATASGMAGDDLAEGHEDQVARLVDHCVQAIEIAEHPNDLELLLVQGVADEVALDGKRILHEARRMEGANCLMMRHARRHDLATAGPARHEMRLDQTRRDLKIGIDEEPIQLTGVPRVGGRPKSIW